jgi:hypothetical protein
VSSSSESAVRKPTSTYTAIEEFAAGGEISQAIKFRSDLILSMIAEQKREAGSRPSQGTSTRRTVGTVDAGDARVQEGLVLKEIEVAQGLLDRVVHRAVGLAALGAREAATGLEVDLDIEPHLASTTIHGGTRPSASWNRSISRMVSPHRPVRRHPAAVLAAVQGQAVPGALIVRP